LFSEEEVKQSSSSSSSEEAIPVAESPEGDATPESTPLAENSPETVTASKEGSKSTEESIEESAEQPAEEAGEPAETEPEVKPEAEPKPVAEAEVKPEAEPEAATEAEVKPEAEPKPVAEAEVKPEAEPEPVAEVEPKAEPEPVPEAEPEPVTEAEPSVVPSVEPATDTRPDASSSSSSSSEVGKEEKEAEASSEAASAGANPGPVSPAQSEIVPQLTRLEQYEEAKFEVHLFDESKNRILQATLSSYPTDVEENDYSEVFQWVSSEKEGGVWEVTFTPDRPGEFVAVVAANDTLISQWNFEVNAGTNPKKISSNTSASVDFEQSWVDPQNSSALVGEQQSFIIALLDVQGAAAWVAPVVRGENNTTVTKIRCT
jgi:hypothetical protein